MARIIFHSRYFKPNMQGREAALSNLMEYIGTREGVELMGERWKTEPESKSQKEMIAKLLKDVPELRDTHEWEDYAANPTKGNASEVITMGTELVLYNTGKVENYVDYIANRPRVDKEGKQHGLFTQTDGNINLAATARKVAEHPGNVWTNVISLRREDAERLGYNNADAWRTLVRAKAAELAKGMKIAFSDFQWYAAFHNESHHPHIHMVCYSTGREGMLTKKGIEEIKSSLASEIFAQDLLQVYTKQTEIRNGLKEVAERYLQLARELPKEAANLTSLEPLIADIHRRLPDHGRMQYGYMSADVKNLVDAAVDVLATNEKISELYDLWYEQKCAVIATYTLKMPEKEPLSDNEAFRSIKNAVIRMAQEYEPSWVKIAVPTILYPLGENGMEAERLPPGETVWELPEDEEPSQVGPGSEIFLDIVRGTGDVTNGNAVVPGNVGEELAEAKAPQEPVKESPFVAREKRARAELEEKLARILQEMQERNAAAEELPEAEKTEEAGEVPGTSGRERTEEAAEETETPEEAGEPEEEAQPERAKPVSWETAAEGFAQETREQPEKPEKSQGAASGETAEYGRKRREASKNQFHDFEQREYTPEQWAAIERKMRGIARPGDEDLIARREKPKEPDFWSKQREDETPRNRFHDFEQRDYDREDWDNIEKIMMLRDAPEKEDALEAFLERYDEKQALRDSAGDIGSIPNPWTKQFKEARSHYRKEEFGEAYRLFWREHQSGNPLGSLWLAQMTERGLGTEANEAEAEALYEQSAKGFLRLYEMCGKVKGRSGLKEREREFADFLQNYLPFRIGKLYARKEEFTEAAEWYQKSDTPYAKYSLGGLYERGQGIEKNRETAFALYKAAADSSVGQKERKGGEQKNEGFPFAEYKVAVMTGDAGEREEYYKRAFAGFEVLSEKDDADDTVFYRLAEMLRQGAGTEQNLDRAVAYYEKAVAMENIYAKYRLGTLLLDAEQAFFAPERGLQLLLEAADKEPRAYYFLGKLYLKGEVVEASRETGLAYLRKATEQGYDMAQYRLGRELLEDEAATQEQTEEGLSWLQKAVEQENPYAQYYLGKLYLTGEHVEANRETGLAYLRKAAEQGYDMAQYRLGRELLEGEGTSPATDVTEEQLAEGLEWLRKAAEQENPYAQYYLGKLYLTGEHVEANRETGLAYLRKAAEQGYDMAQYRLGKELLEDEAATQETEEGLSWLQKAAEQENPYAQYYLGKLYLTGEHVEASRETGLAYLRKAAEQGYDMAQYRLGRELLEAEDASPTADVDGEQLAEGLEWLRKAAEQENPYAQYYLGKLYLTGEHVEASRETGLAYLRKAAEQGYDMAQYRLGRELLEAEDASPAADVDGEQLAEGLEWLRKAAEQENPYAQYYLGKLYLTGEHVEASRETGLAYLRKAAEQGYDMAQYRLGRELLEAEDASPAADVDEEQLAEGLSWLKKAAEQENPYAQYYLGKLYLTGEHVGASREIGLAYLRKAAEQGYDMAQYWLGKELAYADGAGKEQVAEGLEWLKAAAEQKNEYAMYLLAKTYIQGKLVPRDIELGMQYLRAAADEGMELAQMRLQKGVEDWLHEYQPQILPGCIRLLGQIGRIFETQRPGRGVGGIDRKLLREMQEKKEAMGLRM